MMRATQLCTNVTRLGMFVCPLFITHTTGNNRNPKQWSHDRCIEHIMLLGAFFNNQLIKNQ